MNIKNSAPRLRTIGAEESVTIYIPLKQIYISWVSACTSSVNSGEMSRVGKHDTYDAGASLRRASGPHEQAGASITVQSQFIEIEFHLHPSIQSDSSWFGLFTGGTSGTTFQQFQNSRNIVKTYCSTLAVMKHFLNTRIAYTHLLVSPKRSTEYVQPCTSDRSILQHVSTLSSAQWGANFKRLLWN